MQKRRKLEPLSGKQKNEKRRKCFPLSPRWLLEVWWVLQGAEVRLLPADRVVMGGLFLRSAIHPLSYGERRFELN